MLLKKIQRCSRCKDEKPNTEFYKNKSSNSGFSNTCIKCMKKYRNSAKGKAALKIYTSKNKVIKKTNDSKKRGRLELRNYYVVDKICRQTGLSPSDVTPEMINLKRQLLVIKRTIDGEKND